MKKVAFVLLLACVIMGTAFAQAKPATPAPAPAPAQPKAPAPAPAASAAKTGRANAIGGDVFQLVKGLIVYDNTDYDEVSSFNIVFSYERLISPHFSIGGDMDFFFVTFGSGSYSADGRYFNIAFEGRYYPLSESFEKIFVGTTLGYSQFSIEGSTKNGGFSGLNTSLKIGYKYITEKGFFMEPSMSYVLQKSSAYSARVGTPLGWNGGLRLGYAF